MLCCACALSGRVGAAAAENEYALGFFRGRRHGYVLGSEPESATRCAVTAQVSTPGEGFCREPV